MSDPLRTIEITTTRQVILMAGNHNRHYVVGSVTDWIAYVQKTKGKVNVKLLNSAMQVAYLTINTWDSVYYGGAFLARWSKTERLEMQAALRQAHARGRQIA